MFIYLHPYWCCCVWLFSDLCTQWFGDIGYTVRDPSKCVPLIHIVDIKGKLTLSLSSYRLDGIWRRTNVRLLIPLSSKMNRLFAFSCVPNQVLVSVSCNCRRRHLPGNTPFFLFFFWRSSTTTTTNQIERPDYIHHKMTATLDRLQLYLTVYVTKNCSKINAFVYLYLCVCVCALIESFFDKLLHFDHYPFHWSSLCVWVSSLKKLFTHWMYYPYDSVSIEAWIR